MPSPQPILNHLAIIMDGNGRWAKRHNITRALGHRRGGEALRQCVEEALRQHIPYLTVFGFSSENWRRHHDEIAALMGLLRRYLAQEMQDMQNRGVRLQMIGRRTRLPEDIVKKIDTAEEKSRNNNILHLIIALDYGGRDDIIQGVQALARKVQLGEIQPEDIDQQCISAQLYTADIPDPDMIIRTSGELRLSNFLLWQSAYAELYFTPKLWPEFEAEDLRQALADYQRRNRRYGGRDHLMTPAV